MDNLVMIGDQMTSNTAESNGRTDFFEPSVLQWYGVRRNEDGTVTMKLVTEDQVPSGRDKAKSAK